MVAQEGEGLGVQQSRSLIGHMNACLRERSEPSVTGALQWLQELTDCDGVIVCQLEASPEPVLRRFINVSYSPEWLSVYVDQHFEQVDPVLRFARKNQGMYDWGHAFRVAGVPGADRFMEAAMDFGLAGGYAYSFPDPSPVQSTPSITVCSLAASRTPFGPEHLYALQSVMPALHVAVSECELVVPPCPLSEREMEVLRWASSGKTAWEISRVLHISEATAKFHLANIYHKLDVSNRAQAVSKAVHFGWIE